MRPYPSPTSAFLEAARHAVSAFTVGILFLASLTASATGGALIGKTLTRIPGGDNFVHRAVIQPDGKIIVAGGARFGTMQYQITRYNADGTLDTTFATGGTVLEPLGPGNGEAWGVGLQADGKVVVAGHVKSDRDRFGIARFNADGSLDTSFGGGGAATTVGTGDSGGFAMRIQADGKILVAGYSLGATGKKVFTLVRYNTNATLDGTFGSGGIATTPEAVGDETAMSIGIQSSGKIVTAGTGTNYVAMHRFNADGTLDGTWGTASESHLLGGRDLVVQPDDKVAIVGTLPNGAVADLGVLRMTADGNIDGTFGPGNACASGPCPGIGAISAGDEAVGYGIVRQADGKLVVSGKASTVALGSMVAIGRLNADGSVDTTFGSSGHQTFSHSNDNGFGIAMRSDGRFLVAGLTTVQSVLGGQNAGESYDSIVVAFTAAGALDTTFNGTGFAQLDVGSMFASAQASVLQPDGKVVVAGIVAAEDHASSGHPTKGGVIARYLANGTLDTSFGTGGFTTFLMQAKAVAMDGPSIVVAGTAITTQGSTLVPSMAFARFTSSGTLDTSFGGAGGIVTIAPTTSDEELTSVAVQSDGRIVGAGFVKPGVFLDSVFVRLTSLGALDTTFNASGKKVVAMSTGTDQVNALGFQSNGKIVGAGWAEISGTQDSFSATRLNLDGTLDTTFGTGGTATVNFGTNSTHGSAMAIQGNDSIVIGGQMFNPANSTDDFALARLTSAGALDASFGSGGVATNDFGNHNRLFALALLTSGKIVGAGEDGSFFGVVQYLANGTVDTAFGTGGNSAIAVNAGADFANAISVGADGTLYLSGSGSGVFALVRATGSATATGPIADLTVTQAATPNPASTGRDVMFTLMASNNGPASASSVAVTDTLPAGWSFVWASPACANASGTVTCSASSLAAGTSIQFQVVGRPVAAGGANNNASVSATETDSNPANNTSSLGLTVNASPAGTAVVRYRLYSPATQEHLYTTDQNEYNVLGAGGGWTQEGTAGEVLNNPGTFNGVKGTPYYRLYNTASRWHHWTTDPNEYYTLIQFANWNAEGVDGFLLPTGTAGATPLYRLLYPDGRGLHHWTIDQNEYDTLTTRDGWIGEGGTGFVIVGP